jgi:HEAT repeat protein
MAADVILTIAPGDADATRVVEELAKDPAIETAGAALAVLAERAPPSATLTAQLSAALDPAAGPNWAYYDIRNVEGLARCGPLAKAAVPKIIRVLANEEKGTLAPNTRTGSADRRRRIVASLGRIGPDAAAAVPALTALRDKGDETIRVAAAQALRRIKAKE